MGDGYDRVTALDNAMRIFGKLSMPVLQRRYGQVIVTWELLHRYVDRGCRDCLMLDLLQALFLDHPFKSPTVREFPVAVLVIGLMRAANRDYSALADDTLDAVWEAISRAHPTDFKLPEDFFNE